MKKHKYYYVSGYWKDNNEEFEDYLVVIGDEDVDREDVFFYFSSVSELNDAIRCGKNSVHDFVITSKQKYL